LELRVRPIDEKIEVTSRKLSRLEQFVPKAPATCPFDMARLRNQLELLASKAACPRYRPCPLLATLASGRSARKEAKLMQLFTRSTAAVLLIAGGLLGIPAANAQVQSPAPSASDKSANIPDQKLDAAAAAIERVASLKQDYQQRIAAAAAPDKERILNEAVGALKKAVNDQGLSVEEYDSILEVAQNDPDVREKIRQRIRASSQ